MVINRTICFSTIFFDAFPLSPLKDLKGGKLSNYENWLGCFVQIEQFSNFSDLVIAALDLRLRPTDFPRNAGKSAVSKCAKIIENSQQQKIYENIYIRGADDLQKEFLVKKTYSILY